MCYCPTPTLHLNLALTGDGAFIFSLKKTHSVWFISVLNYGDTENVLINHLLLVIPMSYPCHYTNLCPHKPHKHAHTHTHTHYPLYKHGLVSISPGTFFVSSFTFLLLMDHHSVNRIRICISWADKDIKIKIWKMKQKNNNCEILTHRRLVPVSRAFLFRSLSTLTLFTALTAFWGRGVIISLHRGPRLLLCPLLRVQTVVLTHSQEEEYNRKVRNTSSRATYL